MGVPGFFWWIVKNSKTYQNNIILKKLKGQNVDILYLDSNCLFHPQCFKTLDNYTDWDDINIIEDKMIKRILKYLDFLVDYVNPQKKLYISVDGVAPLAKMNQQRKRRFMSVHEKKITDSIKRKNNKKINSNSWSNIVISPGTEFMERLSTSIKLHFKKKKKKKYSIIYSSYHVNGEGEHKILDDIRSRNILNNETYVIYGLDADLIFLSLASQRSNIYLLRESVQFNNKNKLIKKKDKDDVEEELNYLSIDNLKCCLKEKVTTMIKKRASYSGYKIKKKIDNNFINDFIFICFFLGNDFLPHIPSIDINNYGLDNIINSYIDTYIECCENNIININNEIYINEIMVSFFINKLSRIESSYFSKVLPNYLNKKRNRRCRENDGYDRNIWDLNNMKYIKFVDRIKLGDGDEKQWKYRYYAEYTGELDNQKEIIKNMCMSYIEGLKWVSEYYFKGCRCWTWQYPYSHAPFISDLNINFKKMNINNIKFEESVPPRPCVQLLAIIPPKHKNILPKNYQHLLTDIKSELIEYYPIDIKLDMINKTALWKCIPLIPDVNINKIMSVTKDLYLTNDEKIRNNIEGDLKLN